MSQDVRIIRYARKVPVEGIARRTDFAYPVLELTGGPFTAITEVLINGSASPEFVVISPKRLLVQTPTAQVNTPLSSVVVISDALVPGSESPVRLTVGVGGDVAEGMVRLVQNFIRMLLTTPGSDIFRPSVGGNLQAIIGAVTDRSGTTLRAQVTQAVSRTLAQLLRDQLPTLPPEDRYQSATVLDVQFQPSAATLSVRIRLQNMAGDSADAGVNL
jgi:hypothetical protein